jgi:hypothetical protein
VTYANVVATLALFLVLGGGAYAVGIAPKNSVVSKSIKNGQVKTRDLAGNSVNGAKVAADSLTGADINESNLRLSNVIDRPTGGTLAAGGLATGSGTPYPLANATFTQRQGEIIEFVTELKTTLAHPLGKDANNLCQVEIDLELDGNRLATATSASTNSDQLATVTVASRQDAVLPTVPGPTHHTATAAARLVDHSGGGFTDACSPSSRIDSFALDVIGTR